MLENLFADLRQLFLPFISRIACLLRSQLMQTFNFGSCWGAGDLDKLSKWAVSHALFSDTSQEVKFVLDASVVEDKGFLPCMLDKPPKKAFSNYIPTGITGIF